MRFLTTGTESLQESGKRGRVGDGLHESDVVGSGDNLGSLLDPGKEQKVLQGHIHIFCIHRGSLSQLYRYHTTTVSAKAPQSLFVELQP